jgi:hypothetical protein
MANNCDNGSIFEDEELFTINSDDEKGTFDMEASEDGFDMSKLNKHPQERRLTSERLATYVLIGFLGIMCLALIPLSVRDGKENSTTYSIGDGMKPLDKEDGLPIVDFDKIDSRSSTLVSCAGTKGLTIYEWLNQSTEESASLCDPEVSKFHRVLFFIGSPISHKHANSL